MEYRRKNVLPKNRKFTPEQIREIRDEWDYGTRTIENLAKKYGVSTATIRSIGLRHNYKHVEEAKPRKKRRR